MLILVSNNTRCYYYFQKIDIPHIFLYEMSSKKTIGKYFMTILTDDEIKELPNKDLTNKITTTKKSLDKIIDKYSESKYVDYNIEKAISTRKDYIERLKKERDHRKLDKLGYEIIDNYPSSPSPINKPVSSSRLDIKPPSSPVSTFLKKIDDVINPPLRPDPYQSYPGVDKEMIHYLEDEYKQKHPIVAEHKNIFAQLWEGQLASVLEDYKLDLEIRFEWKFEIQNDYIKKLEKRIKEVEKNFRLLSHRRTKSF